MGQEVSEPTAALRRLSIPILTWNSLERRGKKEGEWNDRLSIFFPSTPKWHAGRQAGRRAGWAQTLFIAHEGKAVVSRVARPSADEDGITAQRHNPNIFVWIYRQAACSARDRARPSMFRICKLTILPLRTNNSPFPLGVKYRHRLSSTVSTSIYADRILSPHPVLEEWEGRDSYLYRIP